MQRTCRSNLLHLGLYSTLSSPSPTPRLTRAKGKVSSKTPRDQDVVPEQWQLQNKALKQKFPDGYKPLKKLSREAMDIIRAMRARGVPSSELAATFKISPESVRRVLKSKWRPSEQKLAIETNRVKMHAKEVKRPEEEREMEEMNKLAELWRAKTGAPTGKR